MTRLLTFGLALGLSAAVAILFAGLGFRVTRRRQMARQYGFLGPPAPQSAARQDAAP